ncbi:MAG: HAD-IA family hydrolase [Alphaproteobacteria bacterium]
MTGRLRLVLFDCDGTLVDSQRSIVAAMTTAWRGAGLPDPDPASVRRIVGLSVVEGMARLLPRESTVAHEALAVRYRQAFFEQRRAGDVSEPLYPGALPALDALADAGVLLGVATGKSRRGLVATLEHHGILDRFVTLQTADGGPSKPHPDMVHRALRETGADAADTVVIGDTVFDIRMARAARARSIGVAWGYHDIAELQGAGADRLADAFDAVPGAVSALLAG